MLLMLAIMNWRRWWCSKVFSTLEDSFENHTVTTHVTTFVSWCCRRRRHRCCCCCSVFISFRCCCRRLMLFFRLDFLCTGFFRALAPALSFCSSLSPFLQFVTLLFRFSGFCGFFFIVRYSFSSIRRELTYICYCVSFFSVPMLKIYISFQSTKISGVLHTRALHHQMMIVSMRFRSAVWAN